MIDALAGLDAGQNGWFLVEAIRWNDDRDWLSDGLIRRIAEKTLGAFIPGRDDAVESLADDRIVGGLDDRGKKSCSNMSRLRSFDISF